MEKKNKSIVLFSYDWDTTEFRRLKNRWPQIHSGFDLFSFPSNMRLAWFDIHRFTHLTALKAKASGARAVVSNHEQFGALCAALLAEKMGWPGTPVNAVLACQHKLYAREILEQVAPEANIEFSRLEADYGAAIPENISYPRFVKPAKAAFSVLATLVNSQAELEKHTRFSPWELWVIRHLVEPFERVMRERIPGAHTAHSLILEKPHRGKQFSLDGYYFEGHQKVLGVVDSIMYPSTDSFMRFDYPSTLAGSVQHRAAKVADRFMQAIGFNHGLFNMEFFYDEATDVLSIIEFNPRMASQFSDLYRRVDGLDLHEIAMALSHGTNPEFLMRQEPTAKTASSFVYRSFDADMQIQMPDTERLTRLKSEFPDHLLFKFPKLPGQIERDFKWLRSYRYGILHLGGNSPSDLQSRCEKASHILGWPAPYMTKADQLPGLNSSSPAWNRWLEQNSNF